MLDYRGYNTIGGVVMKDLVLCAYKGGVRAYLKGLPRSPYKDGEFMKNYLEQSPHEQQQQLIKAWGNGWMGARALDISKPTRRV